MRGRWQGERMDRSSEVVAAARARAQALAAGDAERLTGLLHPAFRWTTHTGATYGREAYVLRNTDGTTIWRAQTLEDPHVVIVGDTAVLRAEVVDVVTAPDGGDQPFRMPMTQVWVWSGGRWQCLGGHAGPRRRNGTRD